MSQLHYPNSNPRTLEEKPFATYNNRTPNQPVPLSPQTAKITFNQPQTYQPQSVAPSKTYNYPHNYMQPTNSPVQTYQNKPVTAPNKATTSQNIDTTKLGSQSTVDKKFVPLSYEKVTVNDEKINQSSNDDKDYAKSTILTVLLGFFVLMVIVGVFYGIILYDKSKTPSEPVAGNVIVNANGLKSSSVTAVDVNKGEWKTLPEDESSPLGFLEHQSTVKDNMLSHKMEGSQVHKQSQFLFTHIRKHIE